MLHTGSPSLTQNHPNTAQISPVIQFLINYWIPYCSSALLNEVSDVIYHLTLFRWARPWHTVSVSVFDISRELSKMTLSPSPVSLFNYTDSHNNADNVSPVYWQQCLDISHGLYISCEDPCFWNCSDCYWFAGNIFEIWESVLLVLS